MIYQKYFFKPLSLSILCIASWLYLASPSLAQKNLEPVNDGYQSNEYDAMTGTAGAAGLNPMNIIHRANLGGFRDPREFQDETQRNLDDAAADFKRQQQEQLQEESPNQPVK